MRNWRPARSRNVPWKTPNLTPSRGGILPVFHPLPALGLPSPRPAVLETSASSQGSLSPAAQHRVTYMIVSPGVQTSKAWGCMTIPDLPFAAHKGSHSTVTSRPLVAIGWQYMIPIQIVWMKPEGFCWRYFKAVLSEEVRALLHRGT